MTGWVGGEYVRVTDFFDYVLVWNTGISYGLLASLPVWALGIIMGVAIVALIVWWLRTDLTLIRCALMLIIGGALSNALDRLLYGAVADFFHFHWQEWSFYIFNLADATIALGVGLLILDMLGVGADVQDAAVDARVQGLDPAIEHLGEASQLADFAHIQPALEQRLARPAGRDKVDAEGH